MVSRTTTAIIAVIAFVIGSVVGVLGYNAMTAGSGEASISAADQAATLAAGRPTLAATVVATTVPATVAATSAATVEALSAPVETDEVEATIEAADAEVTADAPAVASTGSTTYRIDSEQSEVRFILQEDLRGERIDVVGTTKDVGGDILVDLANPQNSSVNPIVINARTLATPIDFRNQAIRSRILRSAEDAYEFITFTPTAVSGLPTTAITDGPVTFQVTGDLKIVETTQPVTFDVTVDSISDIELSGSAKAVILYEDFNLSIPNAPGVANVTPEVTLEIDFVAEAVN